MPYHAPGHDASSGVRRKISPGAESVVEGEFLKGVYKGSIVGFYMV